MSERLYTYQLYISVSRPEEYSSTCLPTVYLCITTGKVQFHLLSNCILLYHDKKRTFPPTYQLYTSVSRPEEYSHTYVTPVYFYITTRRVQSHVPNSCILLYHDQKSTVPPTYQLYTFVSRPEEYSPTFVPTIYFCITTSRVQSHVLNNCIIMFHSPIYVPTVYVCITTSRVQSHVLTNWR